MILDKDIFQLSRNTPRPPCDCVYGECKKEITHCADISLPVGIKPTATVGKSKLNAAESRLYVAMNTPAIPVKSQSRKKYV